MKIGIHHRTGSFSERWIEYCKLKNIDYKIVNAYDSDIICQLKDCDVFMWHHLHTNYKDVLSAKNILFALEQAGKKVFPDFNTGWHFDDKVAQMYLLQSINAPIVPSYVFYTKKEAKAWADRTSYPKVFKLRGGSGSRNVRLVYNVNQAKQLINQSFGRGHSQFDRLGHLKERFRKYKLGKDSLLGVFKGVYRIFVPTIFAKMQGREKGYAYFQEFIPNNNYDTRLIIVGERAFGITRGVREGDFRASGSGDIRYSQDNIEKEILEIGFKVNDIIKGQSVAFDFIKNNDNQYLIVEISYGYAISAYDKCPGYWDRDLKWHEGQFNPQNWMIDDILKNNEN